MFGKSRRKVGDIIEPLLEDERFAEREMPARITVPPQVKSSALASSMPPPAPETSSSIGLGLSIVGKIVGQGKLAIFGHVEGEVQASTVQIGNGAQIEGNIVAEELTVGGRVQGMIRANRVKLKSTAVVEGDIYHRSLAVEENAQFDGMSRRQENVVDAPSLIPTKGSPAQTIDVNVQGNGASDSLNPSQTQAAPIDLKKRSTSVPNA
jgi:cytoskeletal protein CcmA (bactofilin family)